MFQFLFSFILFFSAQPLWSAACCGGGLSFPSIITGDDKAQVSMAFVNSEVAVDNVDQYGLWHRWEQHQKIQTMKWEGAHIFSDRYQIGVSVPVMTRQLGDQSFSGLGDITSSISYEYLPEWDYNLYRPKGIGFVQIIAPMSRARVESEVGGLDSRGNGYWGIGVGTLLTKSWTIWDVFFGAEYHRSLQKNITTFQFQGVAKPGSGRTISLGIGYNWAKYRLGVSTIQNQEDPVQLITNKSTQYQNFEQWSALSVSLGYLASEEWTYSATYQDQTILGEPINTSLGRGLTIQIQKRWAR